MKTFYNYNPVRIAMYVKAMFKGKLYIRNWGLFEFDYGKITIPKTKDRRYLAIMAEINRHIQNLRLQTQYA